MKKRSANILKIKVLSILTVLVLVSSCHKEKSDLVVDGTPTPNVANMNYQYDGVSSEVGKLGRVIFYDRNLSLNGTISCGSCHSQSYAFADNKQFSKGLNGQNTTRNSKAILGTEHDQFWDGRAETMEDAVLMPVMNHIEMNMFSLDMLPEKLSALPYYSNLFKDAYGSSEITVSKIREALGGFVNSFKSKNSKFDRANLSSGLNGQVNSPWLTISEMNGWKIFRGKAGCYSCHNGNDLNGYSTSYENIGLDINYTDEGRAKYTKKSTDIGKFIVPTLRNVALTAPYMHDGRFNTLREVIDHYSDGVKNHPGVSIWMRDFTGFTEAQLMDMVKDTIIDGRPEMVFDQYKVSQIPIKRLGLTEQEKKDLEAFLNTLTDVDFIANPKYSNPF